MDQDTKLSEFDKEVYAAAEQFILIHWNGLLLSTRELLIQSGGYREGGYRIQRPELLPHVRFVFGGSIERPIGVMKMFLSAKRPLFMKRGDTPTDPPFDKRELYAAISTCVRSPLFADPVFLELAFKAIARDEADHIAFEVGYKDLNKPSAVREAGIRALCVIALPTLVGFALTEAFGGNSLTASACLFLALFVTPRAMRAIGLLRPWGQTAYQRFQAWSEMETTDLCFNGGAGLLARLNAMTAAGISVPTLAFDLAHLLQSQQTALAALRLPTMVDTIHLTNLDDSVVS